MQNNTNRSRSIPHTTLDCPEKYCILVLVEKSWPIIPMFHIVQPTTNPICTNIYHAFHQSLANENTNHTYRNHCKLYLIILFYFTFIVNLYCKVWPYFKQLGNMVYFKLHFVIPRIKHLMWRFVVANFHLYSCMMSLYI